MEEVMMANSVPVTQISFLACFFLRAGNQNAAVFQLRDSFRRPGHAELVQDTADLRFDRALRFVQIYRYLRSAGVAGEFL